MRPDQVHSWVSEARFRNFLDASDGDHDRAVALYEWNAEVSAAFLEVLYYAEVLLRNAVDRQFPATPDDETVSILSDRVWLTDRTILEVAGLEGVNLVITRLTNRGREETRDRIVAGLNFGFWVTLFTGRYDDLWRSHLRLAFPNGDGRRKEVNDLVQPMRDLRNRAAHHEAVFEFDLEKQHTRCLDLARLIDEDARAYISGQSRVPTVLAGRP